MSKTENTYGVCDISHVIDIYYARHLIFKFDLNRQLENKFFSSLKLTHISDCEQTQIFRIFNFWSFNWTKIGFPTPEQRARVLKQGGTYLKWFTVVMLPFVCLNRSNFGLPSAPYGPYMLYWHLILLLPVYTYELAFMHMCTKSLQACNLDMD